MAAKKKRAISRASTSRRVIRRKARMASPATRRPVKESSSMVSLAFEVIDEHQGLLRRLADR